MTRLLIASLILLATGALVQAQPATTSPYNLNLRGPGLVGPYGSPYSNTFARPGPNLSPYLNLLRGGNPAANYYLGVVPEVERRNNAAAFSAGIQDLSRRLETPPAESAAEELFPTLPQTGHPVQFFNYSYYFTGGIGAARPAAQIGAAQGAGSPRRR
jgi:hypothetical protein